MLDMLQDIRSDKRQQGDKTCEVDESTGDLHALLVNGEKEIHFQEDLLFVQTALQSIGFNSQNMVAISACANNPLCAETKSPTIENLISTINEFKETVKIDDTFVLFVTSHGNFKRYRNGKIINYFFLGDKIVKDYGMERMLRGLDPNLGMHVYSCCYSGRFAELTGHGRNISISSADLLSPCNGHYMRKIGVIFSRYFFGALAGINIEGDLIQDPEYLSIEDAFDLASFKTAKYCMKHNDKPDKPKMRWQNADPSKLHIGLPLYIQDEQMLRAINL